VLTGHSLGACCALLALKLRPRFPGLRCWAFGPPGGFCTRELAHAMRPWCTSVAVGKARPGPSQFFGGAPPHPPGRRSALSLGCAQASARAAWQRCEECVGGWSAALVRHCPREAAACRCSSGNTALAGDKAVGCEAASRFP